MFQHVEGVLSAVSGYADGTANTAHYEMVGTNTTGHAESVRVTFDPRLISYGRILQIYFSIAHDPTELNRQGPDVGTQYRSAIFPINPGQTRVAEAYIDQLNQGHVFGAPIVTKVEPGRDFYPVRGLSPGFPNPQSPLSIHCHQRFAQDREFAASVPRSLSRDARVGCGGLAELIVGSTSSPTSAAALRAGVKSIRGWFQGTSGSCIMLNGA